MINARNGELNTRQHQLSGSCGINPFSLEYFSYAYRLWLIEMDLDIHLEKNKLSTQDMYLRMQILPNSGKFWKTSISFGYVEYLHSLANIQVKHIKPGHSLFFASNITLAPLKRSYLNLYWDFRKLTFGLNNYFLYNHFTNNIGFLFQCDFINDKNFRNRFNDPVLFQFGIRFRASDAVNCAFAYEKHEIFTFMIQGNFGKKIK